MIDALFGLGCLVDGGCDEIIISYCIEFHPRLTDTLSPSEKGNRHGHMAAQTRQADMEVRG